MDREDAPKEVSPGKPAQDVTMLDWFRVDNGRRIRRVLLIGPSLLSLGGLVVALSFSARSSESVRTLAIVVGMALVAAGAGSTLAGMARILREDSYLAIRTDGVALRFEAAEAVHLWENITRIRWDAARGALVLELRGEGDREGAGEVTVARTFAGVTGPALAERLERSRRRVSMGMRDA